MYDGGDTNGTKMTGVKMKQEVAILTVKKLIAVMKRSLKFGATNMTAVEMKQEVAMRMMTLLEKLKAAAVEIKEEVALRM